MALDTDDEILQDFLVEAAEIFPETHFFPISIKRDEKTIIPRGDTVFHSGDHIVFMTEPGGEEELLKLSGQNNGVIKNVMILGGGRVGKKVAQDLSSNNFMLPFNSPTNAAIYFGFSGSNLRCKEEICWSCINY